MRRGLLLLVMLVGSLIAGPALAQPAEPSPEELRTLAKLLRDPAIQSWLQTQAEEAPAAGAVAGESAMAHRLMAGRVDAIRAFLHELAAAVPTLPDEFARAWRTHATERQEQGGPRAGVLLAFAIGSIGAFLLFNWPPLLKEIVLAYLLVFLMVRLVLVLGRILLAPGAERFRVIPMATPSARFWFVWATILVGWFLFVRVTLDLF